MRILLAVEYVILRLENQFLTLVQINSQIRIIIQVSSTVEDRVLRARVFDLEPTAEIGLFHSIPEEHNLEIRKRQTGRPTVDQSSGHINSLPQNTEA